MQNQDLITLAILLLLPILQGFLIPWLLRKTEQKARLKLILLVIGVLIINNTTISTILSRQMEPSTDPLGGGATIMIATFITILATGIILGLIFLLLRSKYALLQKLWFVPFIAIGAFIAGLPFSFLLFALITGLISIPLDLLLGLF